MEITKWLFVALALFFTGMLILAVLWEKWDHGTKARQRRWDAYYTELDRGYGRE
jgi:hypothetical protein